MPKHVPPKIFPGRLHKDNKAALDWGRQNLLAYGSHSYVIIVDPIALTLLQTLDEHRGHVTCLKWSPETVSWNDMQKSYKLQLASADKIGNIIIWNVLEASIATTLINEHSIIDLHWHRSKDHLYLLCLDEGNSLVLWNLEIGSKQWKLDFSEPLSCVGLNPFEKSHVCVASRLGSIFFINDFKLESAPAQCHHKYSITSSNSNTSDFQVLVFSRSVRNIIYFLLTREILVFDLTIHQAIGSIVLERSRSSFCSMLLHTERDNILYVLHQDGSLSGWTQRVPEYKYDMNSYTDVLRMTKQNKKKGLQIYSTASGFSNYASRVAGLTSDGSIWMWDHQYNSADNIYSFSMTGLLAQNSSPISSLSVCPFSPEHQSLLALGTYNGTIQIVDMVESTTIGEYMISHQAVRGVRWLSQSTILAFNCEEVAKNEYKNGLIILDLLTGTETDIRKMSGTESSFIRGIRVSSAQQYFIVLLKDRPFEIWDLRTLSLLKTMKPFSQVTALEWSPLQHSSLFPFETDNTYSHNNFIKEHFVFTLPDGSLRYYTVENNNVTSSDIQADLGMGIISTLAWKGNLLVSGDTVGTIHVWNFSTRKSQVFATNKGLIRRLRFSPSQRSNQVMALFNEGEFGIWDLDHGIRLAVSSYLKGRDLSAVDCDWIAENSPVVATSDGCVRVLDRSLSISSSPLVYTNVKGPLYSPYLLPPLQAIQLKVLLQHYLGPNKRSYEKEEISSLDKEPQLYKKQTTLQQNKFEKSNEPLVAIIDLLDPNLLNALQNSPSLPDKFLKVAKFYGDQEEIAFWTLALWGLDKFVLKKEKQESDVSTKIPDYLQSPAQITRQRESAPKQEVLDLHSNEDGEMTKLQSNSSEGTSPLLFKNTTNELPGYFDLLLENSRIRSMEICRAAIHETKKNSYDLTQKIVELNLLLGQKEKGIEMLLDSAAENPNFYKDSLKAAVVAATISPQHFKNTMKLIATNLIAHGKVDEGVQLLCLIGKSLDACRYLQSYDRWTDAAWLAKISLSEEECRSVLKRWAQFLNGTNQKMKAVQILLTLGEFHDVLEVLQECFQWDLAALFAEAWTSALQESNTQPSQTTNPNKTKELLVSEVVEKEVLQGEIPLEQLLKSIYLEYGFLVHKLGNETAAEFYWQKAGNEGNTAIESARNTIPLDVRTEKKLALIPPNFLRNTQ